MGMLGYDESLVPIVEEAYDTYIRTGRPGVFAACGFVGGFLVAIIAAAIAAGFSRAAMVPTAIITYTVCQYAALLIPLLRCPWDAATLLLKGCTKPRRTCAFALVVALGVSVLEFLAILALESVHVSTPKHLPDLFMGGAFFGTVIGIVVAPVGEELLVQGWFQTRIRGLGGFWSSVIATVFFLILHLPKNPYDFIRGGNLAFAAYLRASTRSLGACILAHACNNAFFFALLIGARLFAHHTGGHVVR
jgi:membrane protease YdiL (CAAX protease family)